MSALAVGEVIGQLLEAGALGADAAVLAATPGHRGALEDLGAACLRLLAPGLLAAVVTDEVGAGGTWSGSRPAVAVWAARSGALRGITGRPLDSGEAPSGTLVAVSGPSGASHGAAAAGMAGLAATSFQGRSVPGWSMDAPARVRAVAAWRPLGRDLPLDRAEGRLLLRLGGRPAYEQLVEAARDAVAAADLPDVGSGLHVLPVDDAGRPLAPAVAVTGHQPATGALALREPIGPAGAVRLLVRDRRALRRAVLDGLPGSCVVIGGPGIGRALFGAGPAAPGLPATALYLGAPVTIAGAAMGGDAVIVGFGAPA